MSNNQERIDNIKVCAEEKSQLQMSCLEGIGLKSLKPIELGQTQYYYENCLKEKTQNYPCLARRQAYLNFENI
jgi:hypothetical protein